MAFTMTHDALYLLSSPHQPSGEDIFNLVEALRNPDVKLQLYAINVLGDLALNNVGHQSSIKNANAIPLLVSLLFQGNRPLRIAARETLCNLPNKGCRASIALAFGSCLYACDRVKKVAPLAPV